MKSQTDVEGLSWRRLASAGAASRLAPRLPGVYAYAESDSIHGLPADLEWIYVGKARDLRARLNQHAVGNERYVELRNWLRVGSGRQVWFAPVSLELVDRVERDLIVRLEPRLNRVRYRSHACPLGSSGTTAESPVTNSIPKYLRTDWRM